MRDISKEIALLKEAERLAVDHDKMDFVKAQIVSIGGKQLNIVDVLVSELYRMRTILNAIQANRLFLPEDKKTQQILTILPTKQLRDQFEKASLSSQKANQDVILSVALSLEFARLQAAMNTIEGILMLNMALLKK